MTRILFLLALAGPWFSPAHAAMPSFVQWACDALMGRSSVRPSAIPVGRGQFRNLGDGSKEYWTAAQSPALQIDALFFPEVLFSGAHSPYEHANRARTYAEALALLERVQAHKLAAAIGVGGVKDVYPVAGLSNYVWKVYKTGDREIALENSKTVAAIMAREFAIGRFLNAQRRPDDRYSALVPVYENSELPLIWQAVLNSTGLSIADLRARYGVVMQRRAEGKLLKDWIDSFAAQLPPARTKRLRFTDLSLPADVAQFFLRAKELNAQLKTTFDKIDYPFQVELQAPEVNPAEPVTYVRRAILDEIYGKPKQNNVFGYTVYLDLNSAFRNVLYSQEGDRFQFEIVDF